LGGLWALEGRFVGVELAWHIRVRLGGLWALKWGWFVGVKVGSLWALEWAYLWALEWACYGRCGRQVKALWALA